MLNDCCLYRRFYPLEIPSTSSYISFIGPLCFSEQTSIIYLHIINWASARININISVSIQRAVVEGY